MDVSDHEEHKVKYLEQSFEFWTHVQVHNYTIDFENTNKFEDTK